MRRTQRLPYRMLLVLLVRLALALAITGNLISISCFYPCDVALWMPAGLFLLVELGGKCLVHRDGECGLRPEIGKGNAAGPPFGFPLFQRRAAACKKTAVPPAQSANQKH